MNSSSQGGELMSLQDYLQVLRRRKAVFLSFVLVMPIVAFALSVRTEPGYRATAQVLLGSKLASIGQSQLSAPTAQRIAETQAKLARNPQVAIAALREANMDTASVRDFLASSSVTADPSADLLLFRATGTRPDAALKLVNAYARAFTRSQRGLSQAAIAAARDELQGESRRLRRSGIAHPRLLRAISQRRRKLVTLQALQTDKALVVAPALGATRLNNGAVRNGLLALGIGGILGVLAAFLAEALDTRVRSADEVAEALLLPLLGQIPRSSRRLRRRGELVMLAEPNSAHAEAFRILRANLDFVNVDQPAQAIMVTSAIPDPAKSLISANLAVALASAGRRVVLANVDLRRPGIDHLFGLQDSPGLTNVVFGQATLDEALVRMVRPDAEGDLDAVNGTGPHRTGPFPVDGELRVLPAGVAPPVVGEFIESAAVRRVLTELRADADIVLLDGPPLLGLGDARTLSATIDGLLVVIRLEQTPRRSLAELRRLLDFTDAAKLGFVVADADVDHHSMTSVRTRRTAIERVAGND